MRFARLEEMTGGWFVGDFTPSIVRTPACEVAVRHYAAGDEEPHHWQEVAAEITAVISGEVYLGGRVLKAGDIVLLEPGEQDASSFRALTDATLVAVKMPSLPHDKRVLSAATEIH